MDFVGFALKTEKRHAGVFDGLRGNYNFALIGPHPRSGDVRARPGRRRSPRPQVRCRATKLFPHARCSCGTRCPWAVLLVASQPLSRPAAFSLRTLLAVYILWAVFGILPTVGLVGRRTSLGLVLASMRQGPARSAISISTTIGIDARSSLGHQPACARRGATHGSQLCQVAGVAPRAPELSAYCSRCWR